ncbi:MAG: patatin-like phospholipase family protein [Rhizobiaceae bacterium]|nr:patatin-like phospholipase family protein [Rhizobiaceae bacterium]
MAKPRARKPKEPAPAPGEPPAGPTVAIAFGGGGARGLAHIHIIAALDELGIRPKLIAGSSIGAIVGAGYAAGMSGSDIADYARSTLGNRAEVMARIWKSRPGTLGELMSAGFRVTQFNIERILRSFLPPVLPQTFDGLKVPLLVTGTDFYANAVTVFDSGDLISAIAASAALPAIFKPVRRDGRIYLDGGLVDPVPFDLLHGKADVVIGVDVVGSPQDNGKRPTSIDLMYGSTQLMMRSIVDSKCQLCPPDVLLRPPVSGYRVLDFLRIEQLMADTAKCKDEAKRQIEAAVEAKIKKRR